MSLRLKSPRKVKAEHANPAEAEPGAVGAAVSWVMTLVCSISFTLVREESEVVEGTHKEPAHSTNHTLSQRKKGECGGMGLQLKGQQRIKQRNNTNLRYNASQARSVAGKGACSVEGASALLRPQVSTTHPSPHRA